jgi:hypothetical protein
VPYQGNALLSPATITRLLAARSQNYMAPEVLLCPTKETPDDFKDAPSGAHYDMAADVWAVGAMAYELLAGRTPFAHTEVPECLHAGVLACLIHSTPIHVCLGGVHVCKGGFSGWGGPRFG